MRLTLKLTIGLVLAILPVIAVSSGVRVDREIAASEADLHDDDLVVGRTVAGAVAAIWKSAGEAEARALVDGANLRQHRVSIRWVWLDVAPADPNAPVAAPAVIGSLATGEPRLVRVRTDGDGEVALTYVAVNSPGGRRGAIEVRRSLAAETSFVSNTIRHAAIAAGTVVGLCGVLALGLGALLVGRPVNRLVAQARRIGAGDLSGRIGLHQKDELGQLGAEIDLMTDHLASAHERIAAASAAQLAALEQLRHADRLSTVGKLAAGVAHEIGTPLNVISGHAQLITCDHAAGTPDHENASIVIEQTQRVAAIIRQLLSFARRHTTRRTPLELGPVVRDTIALLGPLAADRRVAIGVDIGSGPLVCNVDHGQLQQAITNIVVNALQASSTGGRITVEVTRGRATPPRDHGGAEADYARIAIADTGAGIAPDVLPHIFEPFFTTKDVGEGSGLGLSVTYGIVKDHDGWLEVSSRAGTGTRFTVILPIHAEGNVS